MFGDYQFFGAIRHIVEGVTSAAPHLFKAERSWSSDARVQTTFAKWAATVAVGLNGVVVTQGAGDGNPHTGRRGHFFCDTDENTFTINLALWAKWWRQPNQAHNGYIETYLNLGPAGVFLHTEHEPQCAPA